MPQNPAKSGLFVSRVIAGQGITVSPNSGGGPVTVSASGGPPNNVAITGGAISGVTFGAGNGSSVPQQTYNPVATAPTTNNLNLTGANISGGSQKTYLNLTDALGAGATATLPTVAQLVAAMIAAGINPVAGGSYELDVYNSSSANFAWTVTTNTGWTLNGTMAIAQNNLRSFIVTFGAGLATATLQSLGLTALAGGI